MGHWQHQYFDVYIYSIVYSYTLTYPCWFHQPMVAECGVVETNITDENSIL